MSTAKVTVNGTTIVDMTDATATADKILAPYTAYGADGSLLVGTASGGGGGGWTLLASEEFEIATTSNTATLAGTITLPSNNYGVNDLIWVHIRDKAGKRNGYVYGSDALFVNFPLANATIATNTARGTTLLYVNSSGDYNGLTSTMGVYAYSLSYGENDHVVEIYKRYSSSYGTINGVFKCDVYKQTVPNGVVMFD